jgi:DNA-binding CsgD family transcriptional regulator
MPHSSRLWKHLTECLLELHAVPYGPAFTSGLLSVLRRLIPSEYAVYGLTEHESSSLIVAARQPEPVDQTRYGPIIEKYFFDHPMNQSLQVVAPGSVVDISEIATPRWRMSGMLNEVLRPNGMGEQLLLRLPTAEGYSDALGLARPDRPFSEEERWLMTMARDHVMLAWSKSLTFPHLPAEDGPHGEGTWTLERIEVDAAGRVLSCSERAARLLRSWFPSLRRGGGSTVLPEDACRWLRRRLKARPTDGVAGLDSTLVISSERHTLNWWLVPGGREDRHELMFRQQLRAEVIGRGAGAERGGQTSTASRDVRHQLEIVAQRWRLTPRQQDVLSWLVSGNTNKEIAQQISSAEVTVEFHLSNLFRRAGARSRTEVVSRFWSES